MSVKDIYIYIHIYECILYEYTYINRQTKIKAFIHMKKYYEFYSEFYWIFILSIVMYVSLFYCK